MEQDVRYVQNEENEKAGDEPFFCFNITMQKHGGYIAEPYEDIVAKGKEDNSELSTYLSVFRVNVPSI